jgi:integrase
MLADVPLNRITPELLEQVVSKLIAHPYAPETLAKSVRLIRMVLGPAVGNQRLVHSPAANLVAPTPGHLEMRILTVGRVADVADALPVRYRSVPVVAAYMGLRFGELAGLKVDAVDMLRRRLEVRRSLIEPEGGIPYLGAPKSKASARTLSMPENVVGELARHLEQCPPVGGMVWTTERGELLRRGSFGRI